MAEAAVLKISKRDGRGSRKAGKLRQKGQAPAVVYGHKQETISVAVSSEALASAVRHGARVVDLEMEGGSTEKAQIMEVQWDHLGQEVLHADFRRVSADERIHVPVRIELRGIAPGVTAGGALDQQMHTLEVECPAINVPDSIRIAINEMKIGDSIHVRDLKLPADVKPLADLDAIVVHITAPQAEPEAGAEPVPGQAEPEIVGRRVAAEEPEGEG